MWSVVTERKSSRSGALTKVSKVEHSMNGTNCSNSKATLLALVGDVYCNFVTFPCGILDQVWYLIVSFPDLCCLSFFYLMGGKVCICIM